MCLNSCISSGDALLPQKALVPKLISLRNGIASDLSLNIVNIFTNKTLYEMARYRPTTAANLCRLDGVAEQRVNLYGRQFIDVIEQFCREKQWATDCLPEDASDSPTVRSLVTVRLNTLKLCELYMYIRRCGIIRVWCVNLSQVNCVIQCFLCLCNFRV